MKVDDFYFSVRGEKIKLTYLSSYDVSNRITILFFHSNGFSAQTYQKLLDKFIKNNFNTFALNFVGHNGSENYFLISDWFLFSDQILQFLNFIKEKFNIKHFHLVGHSLGGATSLLAGYFNQEDIVSITTWDPVVLTPFFSFFLYFFDPPLAKQAEKRRDHFKSLEIIKRSYRMYDSFKYWDEEIFDDYLKSCFYFDQNSQTYRLCLPKEIEAKIFRSLKFGNWKYYKKIFVPIYVISAKQSKVVPKRACKLLTKNHKLSRYEILDASHFFPMELPNLTAQKTIDFIVKIQSLLNV